MNVKTYEKVLQLDLFSTMPAIPLPPKRKHPHDVKFRKIVGLGLIIRILGELNDCIIRSLCNLSIRNVTNKKENDMLDVVIVLVAIYLGIKVLGMIAGLLIGGKIVYDLTKDKDK
jgi:hypothetical protein